MKVLSETGTDMGRWQSANQFCSWLGLAPGCKISGGKRLGGKTKRTANRAAAALRMAAESLSNSHSALGAFYRKKRYHLGGAKAITATAHKLARIIYAMLTQGTAYEGPGENAYEEQYQQRVRKNLRQKAKKMGLVLVYADTGEAVMD
ncbi:MAG: transposase [Methylovulum sp.]|nr:transposase [Methylovulum sp.]MDD5125389.1 transposase [Methylovulum sp.]